MSRITICLALALGASESQLLADWNSTIAASNPLNWYRLDETSGARAFDSGSQGLTGFYGETIPAQSPTLGVPGLVGTAVQFDGADRNIVFGGSTLTGDWSAEFILMKMGSKGSEELLRGPPLASPSTHLKLEQFPDTHQVGYTQSFVADYTFSPAVFAPLGRFVDLVYVKTASGMKLYMDGALVGSNSTPINLSRYQFGDTEGASPIAVVDEIVVYNRALSAAEIASHHASIPEPGSIVLAASAFALLAAGRRHFGLRLLSVQQTFRPRRDSVQ